MNTKNNKRRRETISKIESVFMKLLKTSEISQIKVTTICQMAQINRGTFYANFLDIYDLADKIHAQLKAEVNALVESDLSRQYSQADLLLLFQHIFEHIKANQTLYSFYFKLGYDDSEDLKLYDVFQIEHNLSDEHLHYHISFFKSGFNTIVQKWLSGGCKETPEQMRDILLLEYKGRYG